MINGFMIKTNLKYRMDYKGLIMLWKFFQNILLLIKLQKLNKVIKMK